MSVAALRALGDFKMPGRDNDLFMPVPVAFIIDLDQIGTVLAVEQYEPTKFRPVLAPRVRGRTSGVSANYFVDTSEYTTGLYNGPLKNERPKPSENRRKDKFEAFKMKWLGAFLPQVKALHIKCEAFDALTAFLAGHDPDNPDPQLRTALVGRSIKDTSYANVTFSFEGEIIVEMAGSKAVLSALAMQDISASNGMCVITGEFGPITKGYDAVKGIPGTLPGGGMLVSFNFRAALPYGFEGNIGQGVAGAFPTLNTKTGQVFRGSAAVGPVAVGAMRRQTQAINYMQTTGSKQHRFRIGSRVYLVWGNHYAQRDIGRVFGITEEAGISKPKVKLTPAEMAENVRIAMGTFNSPRSGEEHTREPHIHLMALTGTQGRVSIVHYQDEGASRLQEQIGTWVGQLAWGAGQNWGAATASRQPWRPTLRSFERILVPVPPGATASNSINGERGRLGEQLVAASFQGGFIPLEIERKALLRLIHGDFPGGSGNSERLSLCALLGAALLRRTSQSQEELMEQQLYKVGQAFALVEALQKQIIWAQGLKGEPAIRKMQTFVATVPSKGFERVMQSFNIALRNRALHGKAAHDAERRMREIVGTMASTGLPARTNDAALFYIGYHHEERYLWTETKARIEAAAERKAASGEPASGTDETADVREPDSETPASAIPKRAKRRQSGS